VTFDWFVGRFTGDNFAQGDIFWPPVMRSSLNFASLELQERYFSNPRSIHGDPQQIFSAQPACVVRTRLW
jgi:hypothetical protein